MLNINIIGPKMLLYFRGVFLGLRCFNFVFCGGDFFQDLICYILNFMFVFKDLSCLFWFIMFFFRVHAFILYFACFLQGLTCFHFVFWMFFSRSDMILFCISHAFLPGSNMLLFCICILFSHFIHSSIFSSSSCIFSSIMANLEVWRSGLWCWVEDTAGWGLEIKV